MKWLLLTSLLTTFTVPYKNIIKTYDGGTLNTVTVKCNCTTNTVFTSYKVLEAKFNPTRFLSKSVKIMDRYNVPPVIALGGRLKRYFKLGDTVKIILNGKLIKRVYADNMNHQGKWESINWDRNDILINADEKYFKLQGVVILP